MTDKKNLGEDNPRARIRHKRAIAIIAIILALAAIVFVCILAGYGGPIGPSDQGRYISFQTAIDILLGKNPSDSNYAVRIIWDVRMPRVAMAAFVGAALAAAGTAMQAVFRNSMADPFIIGVSSGAAVGAAAVSLLGVGAAISLIAQPSLAFLGAVVTVFVVYKLGTAKGKVYVDTLLLSGVAVAAFLGALVSLMLYISGENYYKLGYWLIGSLTLSSWNWVGVIVLPVILGTVIIFLYGRELNVLLLGEETAHNLGANPEFLKKTMLAVAAIMTGVAVAFVGIIGFVGLMIPHMMRLVVGPDHRVLVPAATLGGAMFLIATDTLSRSFVELPVGIITAMLGGPFFLFLLRQRRIGGGKQ